MIPIIGTSIRTGRSNQPCWLAEARKIVLLLRRQRRPFAGGDSGDQDEDLGIPGGNDGDSGSTGGGGGGDWGSDGEEQGDYFGDIANALWLWRALCVCSMLQVLSLHHVHGEMRLHADLCICQQSC